MSADGPTAPEPAPALRVVRGNPDPEELAALVVALTAQPTTAPPAAEPTTSGWADRARGIRAPLEPGPGAWQASARWS